MFPCTGSVGLFGYSGSTQEEYKIMTLYNGQADLLLSLQIYPDYYPYQLKKTALYDYLTNVNKYIVVNDKTSEEKKQIKDKLQSRLDTLFGKVKEFGPSLWNEDLYDTGLVYRNDQFWNNKKTSVLFLEQFVRDDYTQVEESFTLLPSHKKLIVTNYRAARDPYTIFSKEVFECFKKEDLSLVSSQESDVCSEPIKTIVEKLKEYVKNYSQESINAIYRFGKYIEFWNDLLAQTSTASGNSETSTFNSLIIKDKRNTFDLDEKKDKALAQKYGDTLFTKKELETINTWLSNNLSSGSKKEWINYLKPTPASAGIRKTHHPALEQQIIPGTTPLSEGSQKDIVMFLYQFASLINKYVNDSSSDFETEFSGDDRKEFMQNAFKNTEIIVSNLKDRIKNVRDYFKQIKVVDNSFDPTSSNYTTTSSKTFGVVTYPPASFGAGEATIQSMSKLPFIYHDIGLKQPLPEGLSNSISEETEHETLEHEIFSVDDNGWWWKIGNIDIDPSNLLKFKKQVDTLLLLAHEDDWNLLKSSGTGTLSSMNTLLTEGRELEIERINEEESSVHYNKYHLWNEGLRSPLSLNLVLDNLVDIFQKQYDSGFTNTDAYKKAMDWGNYWNKCFVEGKSNCSSIVGTTTVTA